MRHDVQVTVLDRILAHVAAGTTQMAETEARVPTDHYRSPARLADESRVLFRELPLVVGHASEVPSPGDFVTHDVAGVPLVVVRGQDGVVRAFLNVCRHRGARLVAEPEGHRKALTCRYHAWTYDLAGALLHLPLREAFPVTACEEPGLVPVPLECRHGFLWVVPGRGRAPDVDAWLGPVGDDLAAFGLADHHVYKKVTRRAGANWKLIVDAFLEGYHVRSLHRDTIYRFFLEQGTVWDHFAPHVRSAGARRTIREAAATPRERWDVRAFATVFYLLFPNTVLVFHPDWVSHLTLVPDGTDHVTFTHRMLVPALPATDREREHCERTFALIDGDVFQKEDVSIAESIQSVLGAGADAHFRLGRLEHPVRLFHDAIDAALAGARHEAG